MPYSSEWIRNKLFLEHNGIRIFHVYNDNDENDPATFSFGTANDTSDTYDDTNFYVPDLPTWKEPEHPPFLTTGVVEPALNAAWDQYHNDKVKEKAIRAAIVAAIEAGALDQYIEAAKDRSKDTDEDYADVIKTVTLQGFNGIELEAVLQNVEVTAIGRIHELYLALADPDNDILPLREYAVDYFYGTDFTITALRLDRPGQDSETMIMIQDQDGGPSGHEEPLAHMDTSVIIDVLQSLDAMQHISEVVE